MLKKIEILLIILISCLLSLYLFELYLTVKSDTTSKILYYQDKKKVENVVLWIPSKKINNVQTLGSVSNSLTILCNENGYMSTYLSDRFGFNNPDKVWDEKTFDYALIGDSFVQGACVDRPYDIASIIREKYNKSVLNLGVGSIGGYQKLAIVKEYLPKKVKNVIWFYYEGNDLNDLISSKNILNEYLINDNFTQNLKLKQKYLDKLLIDHFQKKLNDLKTIKRDFDIKNFVIQFLKLYKSRVLLFGDQNTFPQPEYYDYSRELVIFKKIIKKAYIASQKINAKFYFVYLPEFSRYKKNYKNDNFDNIKKIINELEIPLIDIHSLLFKKQKNPLIFFPNQNYGHYNEIGYREIARTVFKYVDKN